MKPQYSYLNLIRELAITDFKLKYQGSVLGYLWSFAKPLMLFGVLYVVFTKVARFGAGVDHYPLQLLLGIVLWTYFSDATMTAMASVVDRADLIRKVYFPRIIIVVASSISSLITLILNLIIVACFVLVAGIHLHVSMLGLLPLLVELYVFSLACSLILASLYVKFRDFRHIWEVFLQIGLYATPIIYPLTYLPERYRGLILLNPVAQAIQDARHILISSTSLTAHQLLHSWMLLVPYLVPFLLLAIGYRYFISASAKFAEEV